MRKYTRKQVQSLSNEKYTILIIDNLVYDLTQYLSQHPGGKDILKSVTGTDASQKFRNVGHSITALKRRQSFIIGQIEDQKLLKWRWWYAPIILTALFVWLNKSQKLKQIRR